MKRVNWILFICFLGLFSPVSTLLASPSSPQQPTDPAVYQSQVVYKGDYLPNAVYYKNPGSTMWINIGKLRDYRSVVTCSPALTALDRIGLWHGHIKPSGVCGSLYEPSLYAIGNRINYDENKTTTEH